MSKSRWHFNNIDSPNSWLSEALQRHGKSAAEVARAVGAMPQQFSRWTGDTEKIPLGSLVIAALHLAPREKDHAIRLKLCEGLAMELIAPAKKLAIYLNLTPEMAYRSIMTEVEAAASQEVEAGLEKLEDATFRILGEMKFALLQGLLMVEHNSPLITVEGITHHLRYPVNRLLGFLFNKDLSKVNQGCEYNEFGVQAMENLRSSVHGKTNKNPLDEWVQAHCVHLLARYGAPPDRESIIDLVANQHASSDPVLQRIGSVGLILSSGDADIVEEYIFDVGRNEPLAVVDTVFEVVHYGDENLSEGGSLPTSFKSSNRAIAHILRHLRRPEEFQGLVELDLMKLMRILKLLGANGFKHRTILRKLRNYLESDEIVNLGNKRLRADFVKQFRPILTLN